MTKDNDTPKPAPQLVKVTTEKGPVGASITYSPVKPAPSPTEQVKALLQEVGRWSVDVAETKELAPSQKLGALSKDVHAMATELEQSQAIQDDMHAADRMLCEELGSDTIAEGIAKLKRERDEARAKLNVSKT